MPRQQSLTPEVRAILDAYQCLRDIMPPFPATAIDEVRQAARLRDLLGQFDALFLDGFGVLNVGDKLIDGAEELLREAARRRMPVLVVTNAASRTIASIGNRYADKGLPITAKQIVSSRQALIHWLQHHRPPHWKCIATADHAAAPLDDLADLNQCRLTPEVEDYDAIALLGTAQWDARWDASLVRALADKKRELLIANPDIAAPYPTGFSHEPGAVANALRQQLPHIPIRWFGKPHKPHFDLALARLKQLMADAKPISDLRRIAMVGDSLHTDILGGVAAGLTTVLVTSHGLLRSGGVEEAIAQTGIVPHYITETI